MATGPNLHWDDHYIMEYEAPSDTPWYHTKLLRFKEPFDTTFDQDDPFATTEMIMDFDWVSYDLEEIDVDDFDLSPCNRYVSFIYTQSGNDW